jgi:hypothetical protein
VSADEIDLFVERWHDGQDQRNLRDYLGLTEPEYALWVNDPGVLPYILISRREARPFAEVIGERSGHRGLTSKTRKP